MYDDSHDCLVILVMFISDRASDVKKIGTGGTNLGEMKECEVFNVSLSICGFCELKLHIHASSSGDSRVCIYDKKISMTAED